MTRRIVDLTLTLREGMQTFPTHWHPMVEITQLGRHGIENRETRKLVLGTHTGTHVDAPRHFVAGGATIETIPLDQWVGPARLADFSRLAKRAEITPAMLEKEIGTQGIERVVLRFDWCKELGTMAYYEQHPYLSEEAAQWLVDHGCRLVAMDSPQPDDPRNGRNSAKDSPIHKILLGQGVVLCEYLCNLRDLSTRAFELVVAPLKIEQGDGAPARCFAIEDV